MKRAFIEKEFKPETISIILAADTIIRDYQAQGYVLTLRQLYYQFVARDLIPNTERSYKRLGSIINDARLAGYLDWDAIEDRTRNLQSVSHWDSPRDGVEALRAQYRIDMWANQEVRVEVWIEKEALVGVIVGVCRELDVPFFACRGYVSQSEQFRAGMRAMRRWGNDRQRTVILHLGDHDPSGMDMSRDNTDRLDMFAAVAAPEVIRIALNRDQIDRYRPPPNPAKVTDSRFASYVREHGNKSWELDALEPRVIDKLIRDQVGEYLDEDLWREKAAQLEHELATLDDIIAGL